MPFLDVVSLLTFLGLICFAVYIAFAALKLGVPGSAHNAWATNHKELTIALKNTLPCHITLAYWYRKSYDVSIGNTLPFHDTLSHTLYSTLTFYFAQLTTPPTPEQITVFINDNVMPRLRELSYFDVVFQVYEQPPPIPVPTPPKDDFDVPIGEPY